MIAHCVLALALLLLPGLVAHFNKAAVGGVRRLSHERPVTGWREQIICFTSTGPAPGVKVKARGSVLVVLVEPPWPSGKGTSGGLLSTSRGGPSAPTSPWCTRKRARSGPARSRPGDCPV